MKLYEPMRSTGTLCHGAIPASRGAVHHLPCVVLYRWQVSHELTSVLQVFSVMREL